jgi:hypothetical protein
LRKHNNIFHVCMRLILKCFCCFSDIIFGTINATKHIFRMRRTTPHRIFFSLGSLLNGLILVGNIHQTFKSFTENVISQHELADYATENKTVIKQSNESAYVKNHPSNLPCLVQGERSCQACRREEAFTLSREGTGIG